jgi:hypothetical protein
MPSNPAPDTRRTLAGMRRCVEAEERVERDELAPQIAGIRQAQGREHQRRKADKRPFPFDPSHALKKCAELTARAK